MGIKLSFFEWVFNFLMKKDSRPLRIKGSNSLKHPVGDIDFVEIGENEVLLFLNEMSLLGADSPLQDDFLRGIRVENENCTALAQFLNILQHYLAMFRFNAILEKSCFLMYCLKNEKWQNRFAMYNESFSPEFLRRFLARMFLNAQISVRCFEPLTIENPSPVYLGAANLGRAAVLGAFCTSFTIAMRADVCEIPFEQSLELKRKKDFLNMKFPFKIKLNFSTEIQNGKTCRLGNQKLNESFWLGSKNFEAFRWVKWV
jgi:hypothetical protein